jgi:hypothetical protein
MEKCRELFKKNFKVADVRISKSSCLCSLRLWKAELKGNRQINLVEEISRYPSSQSVAWLLMVSFSQVYSKSCEKKQGHKGLKNLQFGQTRSECEVEAKERMAVKEMGAIKKKPSALH